MKELYHLTLEGNEIDKLSHALRVIGVKPSTLIIHTDETGKKKYDATVELSKYELLYVRLCVQMEIKRIISE